MDLARIEEGSLNQRLALPTPLPECAEVTEVRSAGSSKAAFRKFAAENDIHGAVQKANLESPALLPEKEGIVEYQGIIGTYATVVSYWTYESDRSVSLSDGHQIRFHSSFPIHRYVKYPNRNIYRGEFPYEDLKMAVLKPPSGFANCSYFDGPRSYLILIEKDGQWHPFTALRTTILNYDFYEIYPGIEFSPENPKSYPNFIW